MDSTRRIISVKVLTVLLILIWSSAHGYGLYDNGTDGHTSAGCLPSDSSVDVIAENGGVLIDHVFTFRSPQTVYSFPLKLEKNCRYIFKFTVVSPLSSVELSIDLNAPDLNGDNFNETYALGDGIIIKNYEDSKDSSAAAYFGCAVTGIYTAVITGKCPVNATVYIYIGRENDPAARALFRDTAIYYGFHTEIYYLNLDADTMYSFTVSRENSLNVPDPVPAVNMTVIDPEGVRFVLMHNILLDKYWTVKKSTAAFGHSGSYILIVDIYTGNRDINVLTAVSIESEVGDGPDGNYTNETETAGDNSTAISNGTGTAALYSGIPPYIAGGVIIGIGLAVFAAIYIPSKKERGDI